MYETKFENGELITPYMATGIAEGFEECTTKTDVIKAWSFLIGTKLAYSLQGSFGRTAQGIIESGFIDDQGEVDWEFISLMEDDDDDDNDQDIEDLGDKIDRLYQEHKDRISSKDN